MYNIITRLVSDEKMKENLAKKIDAETNDIQSISLALESLDSTNSEVLEENVELSADATRNETVTHRDLKFKEMTEEIWNDKDGNAKLNKE